MSHAGGIGAVGVRDVHPVAGPGFDAIQDARQARRVAEEVGAEARDIVVATLADGRDRVEIAVCTLKTAVSGPLTASYLRRSVFKAGITEVSHHTYTYTFTDFRNAVSCTQSFDLHTVRDKPSPSSRTACVSSLS